MSAVIPPTLRLRFFGGKGGVGKTTCAAAHAIAAARQGDRVLVVSTDPAHSLGDALGARLSSRPSRIAAGSRQTLFAMELDAAQAFARWLREHRPALGDALEHGSWLDRQDVDKLLDLPIPGIDELLAIVEIVRIGSAGGYSCVVVDTAPTGHTLRLLAAPGTVSSVANVLDVLQREHRLVRRQFARIAAPEAADRFIALLARQADATGALLRDGGRTSFSWVLLPEPLALAESRDGLAALRAAGIRVAELIVNRVVPPGGACPTCDRRRTAERDVLARIANGIGKRCAVMVIAEQPREPTGVIPLARIKTSTRPLTRGTRAIPRRGRATPVTSGSRAGGPPVVEMIDAAELVFIGGKGGVGKTTVAAAIALALARRDPARRVLLLSTDPAHSLGDVLAVAVDDRPRAIGAPSNLDVRELDAAQALVSRRAGLDAAVEEIAGALGSGEAGGHGVAELMNLAPPGIDELFGVLSVIEARDQYARVVVDTAPSGHALRLLEMPDAAREWIQLLLRMLLKYRDLVRPGQLAAELVEMSKSVRRLHEALQDPQRTRFMVVTRAAEVPRRETVRLMARLRALRIAMPAVIVNARTIAPGTCRRCRAIDRLERRELDLLTRSRRTPAECVIIQTPLAAPPPRGVAALDRWARTWM